MSLLVMRGRRPKARPTLGNGAWTTTPQASVTEIVLSQNVGSYQAQTQTLHWQTFVPASYRVGLPHPVLIDYHGSDERGPDNVSQMNTGPVGYINSNLSTFPAIVVKVQIPTPTQGDGGLSWFVPLFDAARTVTAAAYTVDPKRIYLSGISLGAGAVWDILFMRPRVVAAALVCANYQNTAIGNLTGGSYTAASAAAATASLDPTLHIWHFQGNSTGTSDGVVSTANAHITRDAYQAVNPNYVYDERVGWDHGTTCTTPFTMPSVYSWMFNKRRA